MIPEHITYIEPFVGGGAVYWSKPPSSHEIINDKNGLVTNFYQMCKSEFDVLQYLVQTTPHARAQHTKAKNILQHAALYNPVRVAWAFWVQTNMSFSGCMFRGYAFEKLSNGTTKKIRNKKLDFDHRIVERLENTEIENKDALEIIKQRDHENAFFYLDPPYIGSNQ